MFHYSVNKCVFSSCLTLSLPRSGSLLSGREFKSDAPATATEKARGPSVKLKIMLLLTKTQHFDSQIWCCVSKINRQLHFFVKSCTLQKSGTRTPNSNRKKILISLISVKVYYDILYSNHHGNLPATHHYAGWSKKVSRYLILNKSGSTKVIHPLPNLPYFAKQRF